MRSYGTRHGRRGALRIASGRWQSGALHGVGEEVRGKDYNAGDGQGQEV